MDFKFNYELTEQLTQVNGISGNEGAVCKLMYDNLKDLCDEVEFDNLGSIIFIKRGKKDGPKVMIAAHMDQIGFVICDIDDNGFAFIKPIGGWWPTQLLTQEVSVETDCGKVYTGVIGHKPSADLSKQKEIKWDDIFIDFGVLNKQELLDAGIMLGNPVTPLSTYKPLVNPRFVATKAWDNRVGCAAIAELLINLKDKELPCDLYLVGTVQEEVGIRGAKTAAQKIKPDVGISIDIGGYGDTPGCKSYESALKLGKGPSIAILDATAIGNRKLVKLSEEIAVKNSIPYQRAVMLGGGTDTGEMHKSHEGALPLTISIATRYGHSHNSIINLDDFENSVKLLAYLSEELTMEKVNQLKSWF